MGKLKRLRLFPMHTLTNSLRIARFLHSRRTASAAKELQRRGMGELLRQANPHALSQDPADLIHLYDTVLANEPDRAIEFGSGQSTMFIAQALHDLGDGHLWSLDADPEWLEHTKGNLPDHLKPFVTFVHAPAYVSREYGVPAFRYGNVPDGEWDFVLIDGPALTPEVRLSMDLIEIAPKLRKGAVGMIDHRWRSAVLAQEVAGDRLKLRYMPSLESFSIRAA